MSGEASAVDKFKEHYERLKDTQLAKTREYTEGNIMEFTKVFNSLEVKLTDTLATALSFLYSQTPHAFERYLLLSGMIALTAGYDPSLTLKSLKLNLKPVATDNGYVFDYIEVTSTKKAKPVAKKPTKKATPIVEKHVEKPIKKAPYIPKKAKSPEIIERTTSGAKPTKEQLDKWSQFADANAAKDSRIPMAGDGKYRKYKGNLPKKRVPKPALPDMTVMDFNLQ